MQTPVNAQTNATPRRPSRWFRGLTVLVLVAWGAVYVKGRVRPTNLGVHDGKLAPCPARPNCVSTQAIHKEQRIAPLRMIDSLDVVTLAAREAILKMPRAKFVKQAPDYCHVETTSLICRYVDDFEVWIDQTEQRIHARSASRVGYSDLGVNRERVTTFFSQLVEAGVAEPIED